MRKNAKKAAIFAAAMLLGNYFLQTPVFAETDLPNVNLGIALPNSLSNFGVGSNKDEHDRLFDLFIKSSTSILSNDEGILKLVYDNTKGKYVYIFSNNDNNLNTLKYAYVPDFTASISPSAADLAKLGFAVNDADPSANNGITAHAVGNGSVAIGDKADSTGASISIGASASSIGNDSVTIGNLATSNVHDAVVVGHQSSVTGVSGTALGSNSLVSGKNAVAIGSDSVATTDGEVSFGHSKGDMNAAGTAYTEDLTRRLTHVATPTDDYDAANKKYVDDTVKNLSTGATYTAGDNIEISADHKIGLKDTIDFSTSRTIDPTKVPGHYPPTYDLVAIDSSLLNSTQISFLTPKTDFSLGNNFDTALSNSSVLNASSLVFDVGGADHFDSRWDSALKNHGDSKHRKTTYNASGITFDAFSNYATVGDVTLGKITDSGITFYAINYVNSVDSYTVKFGIKEIAAGGLRIQNVGTPTDDKDAVTKKYVDDKFSSLGTSTSFTGDMGGKKITNLAAGTADTDAVNKKQMADADTAVQNAAKTYTDTAVKGLTGENGEITNINKNITTITGDVTNLKTDVKNVQGDVTTIKGDITNIKGDVTNLDNRVNTVEGDITNIKGNVTDLTNKYNTLDGLAVKYSTGKDGAADYGTIALAGANGTKITNLAKGTEDSDAVNLKQMTDYVAANGGNDKLAVKFGANQDGTANKSLLTLGYVDKDGQKYTNIQNVANGVSTYDAVNFGQLEKVRTDLESKVSHAEGRIDQLAVTYAVNADGSINKKLVSFGSTKTKDGDHTLLSNVAEGQSDYDAVNKKQLDSVASLMKSQTDLDSDLFAPTDNGEKVSLAAVRATPTIEQVVVAVNNLNGIAVKYDGNVSAVDKNNITFGGQDGTTLHNVKAGTADTDAVNKKQMADADTATLTSAKGYTDTAITGVNTKITDLDTAYKAADTAINTKITDLDTAYKAADTKINTSIADLDKAYKAADTAIDTAYKAADTELGKRIDGLTGENGTITNLADRVTTVEGDITTIKGDITTINGNVTDLGNRMTTVEGDITNIKGDITTINGNVTDLTNKYNTLDGLAVKYDANQDGTVNKTSLTLSGEGGTQIHNVKAGTADTDAVNKKQMADADTAVQNAAKTYTDTAVKGLTGENGAITNIDKRVTTVEGDITNIRGDITTINGNVTDLTNKYNTLDGLAVKYDTNKDGSVNKGSLSLGFMDDKNVQQNTVIHNVAAGTADTDAANTKQVNDSLTAAKSYADQKVEGLTGANGEITNIKTDITNLGNRVTTVEGDITNIQGDVTTIKSDITTINGSLTDLTDQFNSLDGKTVQYSVTKDGAVDFGTIALKGQNGTTITGVADGKADSDAVNYKQLKAVEDLTKSQTDLDSDLFGPTKAAMPRAATLEQVVVALNNLNTIAVRYDGNVGAVDKSSITFGGQGGTVLHNVKAGTADTDVANVKQVNDKAAETLTSAKSYTDEAVKNITGAGGAIDEVKKDIGDTSKIDDSLKNKDQNGKVTDTSVVEGLNNLNTKVDGVDQKVNNLTTRVDGIEDKVNDAVTAAGQHTTIKAGTGVTVTEGKNAAGGKEYTVGFNNDKAVFGDGKNSVTIEGNKGSITATGTITAGNTSISNNSVKVGDNTYISDKGLNANKQTITNVADGKEKTDAVNKGQLDEVAGIAVQNSQAIGQLGGEMKALEGRTTKAVAGAAALAALNPLDYDPDNKLDFAAAVGSYKGSSATALGMYYRPNENIMFSLGGSFGNGENMWNAGVSFKLGSGKSDLGTKEQMKRALKAQGQQLEDQKAQIAQLTAAVEQLLKNNKDKADEDKDYTVKVAANA